MILVDSRLNDRVQMPTIITTLFMPISSVPSFLGMNFYRTAAPPFHWTGIPALAVMVIVAPMMRLWARRRGWT
jgi:Mg2+ and Co2+ transporter CorA